MKTTIKILGGLFLLGLILLPFDGQLKASSKPKETKDALINNLHSFCYEIAIHQIRGFSAFDYDLVDKRVIKEASRAVVVLRHEHDRSKSLRCVYKQNKVMWNTFTREGYYPVPGSFSKKEANYIINGG